jgi:hypothetical protein
MTNKQQRTLNTLMGNPNVEIRTIEYPSNLTGFGVTALLKLVYVKHMKSHSVRHVSYVWPDGETAGTMVREEPHYATEEEINRSFDAYR